MVTLRYAKAADQDLSTIYLTSDELFGPAQADAYVARLKEAVDLLAEYPLAARLRTETRPPVRVRRCGAHMIVYVVDEVGVLILRFRHGHEDWRADPLGDEAAGDPS